MNYEPQAAAFAPLGARYLTCLLNWKEEGRQARDQTLDHVTVRALSPHSSSWLHYLAKLNLRGRSRSMVLMIPWDSFLLIWPRIGTFTGPYWGQSTDYEFTFIWSKRDITCLETINFLIFAGSSDPILLPTMSLELRNQGAFWRALGGFKRLRDEPEEVMACMIFLAAQWFIIYWNCLVAGLASEHFTHSSDDEHHDFVLSLYHHAMSRLFPIDWCCSDVCVACGNGVAEMTLSRMVRCTHCFTFFTCPTVSFDIMKNNLDKAQFFFQTHCIELHQASRECHSHQCIRVDLHEELLANPYIPYPQKQAEALLIDRLFMFVSDATFIVSMMRFLCFLLRN